MLFLSLHFLSFFTCESRHPRGAFSPPVLFCFTLKLAVNKITPLRAGHNITDGNNVSVFCPTLFSAGRCSPTSQFVLRSHLSLSICITSTASTAKHPSPVARKYISKHNSLCGTACSYCQSSTTSRCHHLCLFGRVSLFQPRRTMVPSHSSFAPAAPGSLCSERLLR